MNYNLIIFIKKFVHIKYYTYFLGDLYIKLNFCTFVNYE